MHYVSTATSIQTALGQFRFDWDKLRVSLGGKIPAPQEVIPLIKRIEEFNTTVRGLVEGETKAWVADFQQNLSELEKYCGGTRNGALECPGCAKSSR